MYTPPYHSRHAAEPGEARLLSRSADELYLPAEALLALARTALVEKCVSFRFQARGSSMVPFIRDGDTVTLAPLGGRPPTVGDVVAFVHPVSAKLVVHRVVARRPQGVLIRADNSARHSDGWVALADVLGRVTEVLRDGRRVWLGLGPERRLVAWISRPRLLLPLWRPLVPAVRKWRRLRSRE